MPSVDNLAYLLDPSLYGDMQALGQQQRMADMLIQLRSDADGPHDDEWGCRGPQQSVAGSRQAGQRLLGPEPPNHHQQFYP